MTATLSRVIAAIVGFVQRHTIIVGAVVIYAYYLVLTLDLFEHQSEKSELLSLILQFDSLLLMWGVIFVFVQLQKFRHEKKEGEKHQRTLLHRFQEQQLQLASLDDISDMLNDRINNPLSVISLSAGSLRKRTNRDTVLSDDVDRIESALKRVQEVMMGIQAYHTKKIIKLSREMLDEDTNGNTRIES
jgi:hypothetical protein